MAGQMFGRNCSECHRTSPSKAQGLQVIERDLPEGARGGRELSRQHWHEECEAKTRQ
jgi:hypothetical protein